MEMAMHPIVEEIRELLTTATQGMSDEDWSRHPEGKWSATEVVEHLSLTYSGTLKSMQRVLDNNAPTATPLKLKQRLGILWVVELGRFPEGREAPMQVRPTGTPGAVSGRELLSVTLENLTKMDTAIATCEQRFGSATRLSDHPILGALSATQWRKFHRIHARHHALQIERLRLR
jgi:DinB superfamily